MHGSGQVRYFYATPLAFRGVVDSLTVPHGDKASTALGEKIGT